MTRTPIWDDLPPQPPNDGDFCRGLMFGVLLSAFLWAIGIAIYLTP
jgi:hypothetical protein